MRRREFITLVIGAAASWPLTVLAQQSIPVIGFLSRASAKTAAPNVAAFVKGLNETGFDEGRNVAIEYRWADDQYERLPELAADLVARRVQRLVAKIEIPFLGNAELGFLHLKISERRAFPEFSLEKLSAEPPRTDFPACPGRTILERLHFCTEPLISAGPVRE